MTQDQIYAALTPVFHDVFDDDSLVLRPEMTAENVPEWDSHNHISLIVATEMRFRIKFQTAEIESLRNVGELVACIERKVAKA